MDSGAEKISEDRQQYFKNRNVPESHYENLGLQAYLKPVLPDNKNAQILDIGCGFGQTLMSLRGIGYSNLNGIDISDEAVMHCTKHGISIEKITDIIVYSRSSRRKYDFIILSHVLEHIDKSAIIDTLINIRKNLMNLGASLVIMVPNAQSYTGCYWAYEDFTHSTLFTAGSLYYVLKSAGFESVDFLDPYGTEGHRFYSRWLIRFFMMFYKRKLKFWNFITQSSFHDPSPKIFTYEIKAIAK